MPQKYNRLALFAGIFLLTGCCTKSECIIPAPSIPIYFEHFSADELQNRKIYLYDKNTNQAIDSFTDLGISPDYYLSLSRNDDQLKNCTVEIKTGNNTAIIDHISYDAVQEKKSCNKCFLSDGSTTVINYRNISLRFNGNMMTDPAQLTITK
jgi:hypothetical protein